MSFWRKSPVEYSAWVALDSRPEWLPDVDRWVMHITKRPPYPARSVRLMTVGLTPDNATVDAERPTDAELDEVLRNHGFIRKDRPWPWSRNPKAPMGVDIEPIRGKS